MLPSSQKALSVTENRIFRIDPIDTIQNGYDDPRLLPELTASITTIDDILETDDSLSDYERRKLLLCGRSLRLDMLYAMDQRGIDQTEFSAQWDEIGTFLNPTLRLARETRDIDPVFFWRVSVKHLDYLSMQAYRNARESQTTLSGTPEGDMTWILATDQAKSVLRKSTRLMRAIADYSEDETVGHLARGQLFEVMVLTYLRTKDYEEHALAVRFARSAVEREDKPWNDHVIPKRAIDIVYGGINSVRMLQARNHEDNDEYAEPIKKVTDIRFRKTLGNLNNYLIDFQVIAYHGALNYGRDDTDRARSRLDAVFGVMLDRANAN